MQAIQTPGVHIQHVLTETKRVLQTGVPVFLGLIHETDRTAFNDTQAEEANKFIRKPILNHPAAGIARKQISVRLPKRPTLSRESRTGDSMGGHEASYLRAVVSDRPDPRELKQVQGTYGAAGPSGGLPADAENLEAISSKPQRFTVWPQFAATYGGLQPFGFFTYAVRGFFENGGRLCYVQLMVYDDESASDALTAGLETLSQYDEYDLVCVPDLMWLPTRNKAMTSEQLVAMQAAIAEHCGRLGDRFAVLDSLPQADIDEVLTQRHNLYSQAAALYYPWICVANGPLATASYVPPCGHVAGVFARTDRASGVHKAPANEVLAGALDLATTLTDRQQGPLNDAGINCLRSFPRRGIRVWGARTLSYDPAWTFINVRRIFITAARWIERNMNDVLFEPHTPELWRRIVRELTVYFTGLLKQGALAGGSAEEAFFVKCDAETDPLEEREVGRVVTEIGLATTVPTEYIVIRIMHGPTGVRIIGTS